MRKYQQASKMEVCFCMKILRYLILLILIAAPAAYADWKLNPFTNKLDYYESGAGGAPVDATYITQTADGDLSGEQALSSLSTGIMRVATTTGAITSLTDSAGLIANISD